MCLTVKSRVKSISRKKVEHAKTPGERLYYMVLGLISQKSRNCGPNQRLQLLILMLHWCEKEKPRAHSRSSLGRERRIL